MQRNSLQKVHEYLKEHMRKKRWGKILTAMICVVVFCTTYALIFPGVTMTGNTYCGKEEHTHTEECYESVLICGQEETQTHKHTEECYDTKYELVCGKEKSEGHIHSEGCYDESGNLICGLEESEGHAHDESCYQEKQLLICGESEEGHAHTDECYERRLVCGKEEHTHSLICYSNPEADLESASVWEQTVPKELSNNWAQDVLAVAKSQMGYAESTLNYEVREDNSLKGYTRYGAWYGDPYGDWCAMFVSFCLNYANIPETSFPYEASCQRWIEKLEQINMYAKTGEYTPKPGDLIFFDFRTDGLSDHVGLVEEVETDENGNPIIVKTIEGNYGGKVTRNTYEIDDTDILGYGILPEHCGCYDQDGTRICEEDCDCGCHAEKDDVQPAETKDSYSVTYSGENYDITLSWADTDILPEGTQLEATEIQPETEEYERYYQETTDELVADDMLTENTDIPFAGFFDISLSKDGENIEPNGTVNVTVRYADNLLENVGGIGVVHFKDNDTELIDATAETDAENGTEIKYSLNSFSVVGVYAAGLAGSENAISLANDGVSGTGAGKVVVNMAWSDGNASHSGESLLITLCKDGVETDKTAELSSENEWSCTFDNLSEESEYSLKYATVDGYVYNESCKTASTGWTKVSGLSQSGKYALVYNNTSTVASNGSSLSQGSVTASGDRISDVTEAMQWEYNGSTLKNVQSGSYLQLIRSNRNYSWQLGSSGSQISYSNNKLSALVNNNRRYLSGYNTVASYESEGTDYTLYRETAVDAQLEFTIVANKANIINPAEGDSPQFEHNKKIDYLNDGVANPDTTLTGKDNYRLYLDMIGKEEPVDLLVVVDSSGSMSKTDMLVNGTTYSRADATTLVLNGSTTTTARGGFISYFLGLNSENKISVVRFYGNTSYNGRNNSKVSINGWTKAYDSTVALDWTSTSAFVSCKEETNNGTNYEAGLKTATEQLAKVSGDGRRKIMIFLSDGVPTYFMIDQNDVGKYSLSDMTNANVGKRWGNGVYASADNYSYCMYASKQAFDDFMQSNPGVTVFTIGVSKDISETSESGSQSPEVLKYMAQNGGGSFVSVVSDMNELKYKLQSMFYPGDVTITDELSKYVRFYNDQPDVKVTMTNVETGEETVLWDKGQNMGVVDDDGNAIFDRVVYTPGDTSDQPTGSTGTVKAIFSSGYLLNSKYRYTLSYNVQTTQTAYTEYRVNGNNYGGIIGDDETDYGTNTTSSGQPGFRSNTGAYVSYKINDAYFKEYYEHPVVQVDATISGYALPETGGNALWITTIGGGIILCAGILLGCRMRRKRERRFN